MCGIAGVISRNPGDVHSGRLKQMTDIISHRGPDGDGQWIAENGNVGFGHRRLSILDLSALGSQPMHYLDRYTIVFNGEIYNYLEIKETLIKQGYRFHTTCDTEVLMAIYDRDKEACLQYLDGMFAFAIYDKVQNSIFIARDRFGEKPFFYSYEAGKSFVFGSELKVLWAASIKKEINPAMLHDYLTFGQLENPENQSETFYKHCYRLPASHSIKIDVQKLTIDIRQYYDIDHAKLNKFITEKEASQKFQELFYTSVKRRLRSDVPVGSSLSGGLDSSLIVTVINELVKGTEQKQKTFSAIFPGFKKDERAYMEMVIDQTNVEPHFIKPTDEGMIQSLDKLSYHQEEPFGSASVYVQYCVMRLAKENGVTVLLDGQGADEILAGYYTYFKPFHNELKNRQAENAAAEIDAHRKLLSYTDNLHGANTGIMKKLNTVSPKLLSGLRKAYHAVNRQDPGQFFTKEFKGVGINNRKEEIQFPSLNEALYYSTFKKGLHELLRYADRNSMAHSREIRLPFLNADLVEFLFSLPAEFKIRHAWTKWIMRESFSGLLPQPICWRKDKIGYEPPQKSWMENPLFIEKIRASQERLVKEGILKKTILDKKIEAGGVGQTRNSSWSHFTAGNLFAV